MTCFIPSKHREGWRKISTGFREDMWRYSGEFGTVLLVDYSEPPEKDSVIEYDQHQNRLPGEVERK